ncbi:MAG: nicotinate-nucleotide adenylyltransferase [Gemmataceae bacterium]
MPTTSATKRVGVFGGTFDPVHLGHLIVAEQCREQARLDEVWFVPAARPPHKSGRELTPFSQRVEMLALALAGNPAFRIDELENERPGPSYMADTLAELRRRHPDAELFFILGADSLNDLPYWHEPRRIVELAHLLIVDRPGWTMCSEDELRRMTRLPADVPLRSQVIHVPLLDNSSSDIRRRVAEGRGIRYLVPRAVEAYIEDKKLYREEVKGTRLEFA